MEPRWMGVACSKQKNEQQYKATRRPSNKRSAPATNATRLAGHRARSASSSSSR